MNIINSEVEGKDFVDFIPQYFQNKNIKIFFLCFNTFSTLPAPTGEHRNLIYKNRQCGLTYNVTLKRIRVTIIAVEKQ
jgi:hypothetical protein